MSENKNGAQINIGSKIRDLRLKMGLTQEELADRAELSKGYISRLENDLTSISISTLIDILTLLGSNLSEFFSREANEQQLVFGADDFFVKKTDSQTVTWVVPTAQKNALEPIIIELERGAQTDEDIPHEGEEFGYVLQGAVKVTVGERQAVAKKGETFYFSSDRRHGLINIYDGTSKVLWVSCPPTF